jgi:hypothetical protein
VKFPQYLDRSVDVCLASDVFSEDGDAEGVGMAPSRSQIDVLVVVQELSAHFDTLEIPYVVRLEVITVGKKRKAGFTLVHSRMLSPTASLASTPSTRADGDEHLARGSTSAS